MTPGNSFLIGLLGSVALAVVSHRLSWLSLTGAAAVVGVGTVLFGVGGLWTAGLVFYFFLTSSLASSLTSERKRAAGLFFAKGKSRDWGQVLANGGVPVLLTIGRLFVSGDWYLPAITGSLAAVTADTWATELGTLRRARVIDCLTFRPVSAGTSGGISIPGSLWAAAGALSISLLSALTLPGGWSASAVSLVMAGSAGGFLGALVDSVLGAGLQARFRCNACGQITEEGVHCGRPANHLRGLRCLGNGGVNLTASLVGATAARLLFG